MFLSLLYGAREKHNSVSMREFACVMCFLFLILNNLVSLLISLLIYALFVT